MGLAPPVLDVTVTRDAERFAAATERFLLARPVEHNILATVLGAARESEYEPVFAWAQQADEVVAAVLRTPPRRLLASTMTREGASALMAALLDADSELPGVNGPQPASGHLARAWRDRTQGTVRSRMSQVVYALDRVEPPAEPPPGETRLARADERDRLVEWAVAFTRDVGIDAADADRAVDRGLRHERLFVWDEDGAPTAMVGVSPPVGGVVRVSLVYTPPDRRGRGRAGALTADVSGRVLAGGASRCMLYADRANPTSNGVYRRIGYRTVGEAQEYDFTR